MTHIYVIGGTCIDYKDSRKNPEIYYPSLGGDAANGLRYLRMARAHGWDIDAKLITLIGSAPPQLKGEYNLTPIEAGYAEYIIRELKNRNPNDMGDVIDPYLVHAGPARAAVWRYNAAAGAHALLEPAPDPGDALKRYWEIPTPQPSGNDIVLWASAATTFGFDYLETYGRNLVDGGALVILSPNTRRIGADEIQTQDGQTYNKREFYGVRLSRQMMQSHLVMAGMEDLKHMYPDFAGDRERLDHLRGLTVGAGKHLVMTGGEAGMEIYDPRNNRPIFIATQQVGKGANNVGAGGAALTGLAMALSAFGVKSRADLMRLNQTDWHIAGNAMTSMALYHLEQKRRRLPFPHQIPSETDGFTGVSFAL